MITRINDKVFVVFGDNKIDIIPDKNKVIKFANTDKENSVSVLLHFKNSESLDELLNVLQTLKNNNEDVYETVLD